jgi:hypothetical protein
MTHPWRDMVGSVYRLKGGAHREPPLTPLHSSRGTGTIGSGRAAAMRLNCQLAATITGGSTGSAVRSTA